MKYKKFDCAKCGHSWLGYAKKPKCRSCGSKMVNVAPAIINEDYLSELQKKAGEKEIINKFQKKKDELKEVIMPLKVKDDEKMVKKNNEEFNENIFYGDSSMESEEVEEVVFKCSCGGELKRGDLFCKSCNNALDIDWNLV